MGSIRVVIIISYGVNCRSLSGSADVRAWHGSDYQSNSEYYKQLTDTQDFTQMANLRLDRLSSPRFHPSNGKSVIYLRRQYHTSDLKGSSMTIRLID
jgi:hypothetical protein